MIKSIVIRKLSNLRFICFITLLLNTTLLTAQSPQNEFIQGYTSTISGKSYTYHSPLPNVNASLIMRGRADFKPIRWKTAVIPDSYAESFVSFIWIYGMDTDPEPVPFILRANGKECLRFSSPFNSEIGSWHIDGENGARLTFNVTMLDKFKDEMGFAILRLPTSVITPGEAVILEIDAEPVEDNSWFMTYKSEIKEKIDIYQNRVVVKKGEKLMHSVSLDLIRLGKKAVCRVLIGKQEVNSVLTTGNNRLEILLPKVDKPTDMIALIEIEGRDPQTIPFTLEPVKEWEIFLVQHTHSDIGYTRPQTEIIAEHLRYIDHALVYCDQTDDYPDASKFRWTCETSWSVREFLDSRPQEQIDKLVRRIKEGRIEATGMFLNYSEIIDEPALAAQTRVLRKLKQEGIDVHTAMQNDVNGIAWCLVDYFSEMDLKYLTMGIHAHRARKPFGKPTAFWWQSPAGNQLLAYRSEHYMHGNTLSLHTGQQDVFRANLSHYLSDLEKKDYPYDKISLQFSGYVTDNSPPNVQVCDIIRKWNEKYEWPKLRSALAKEFMIYLDDQHAKDIEVKEVAWPDWWTDGVASATNETGVVRNAHVDISNTEGILSMARLLGQDLPAMIREEVAAVYDNLLFYDEHTHGAAESVRDPLSKNTINQWAMKSAYAWEAAKLNSMLEEKALAFLEPALGTSEKTRIIVFNTLNHSRSGMVQLFIENGVIPETAAFTITDSEGREIPWHVYDRRMEGAYYRLWVADIPAVGYATLLVNVGETGKKVTINEGQAFENQYYRITIDPDRAAISGIYDKTLQKDLLDRQDSLGLGAFIYEELANRHEMERLTESNRDTIYRPLTKKRSLLSSTKILREENGSIYRSITLHGDMPVCADSRGVEIEIRLYHYMKKIELHYKMVKLEVQTPEAVYVSFPFKLKEGLLAYEAQGGIVYPGKNQLEGSSADWNAIQNFAAVRSKDIQVVFVSKDIPLVQFGNINTGRYYYRLKPETNHIYSWVLNNYWVTNFKASQQGELNWSYTLTSSDDVSNSFATHFGKGERTPLTARIILPSQKAKNDTPLSRSILDLDVSNLLLVNTSLSMEGKGIVLHLRETEGSEASINIKKLLAESGARSAERVNILEEKIRPLQSTLKIESYETCFIRLTY